MELLKSLEIEEVNYGASISDWWSTTKDAGVVESYNPTTGKILSKVYQCSDTDYDRVIKESELAFDEWRMVPAPIRGQLIFEMASELREKKDLHFL